MQQVKRKNPYLGLIIVVSTLTIIMFILLIAVGAFLFSGQFGLAQSGGGTIIRGRTPLNTVDPTEIDPALALASLGGVSEADVIIEAIRKGRPETALAALAYRPTLPDKESAGDFLLLGDAYQANNNPEKAVFCYQMAGLIGTLSPNLADTVRSDVFVEAAEKLMALNQPEWAKFYLDQAFVVAAKSPFLQGAHRRGVFERLQKDYTILYEKHGLAEARELARQSLNLSARPQSLAGNFEQLVILPQNSETIALPLSLQEAEAHRWSRAQELAALLVERGGNAPQSAKEALKEALLAEDAQKLPFYAQELSAAAQLSRKIDITLAQIEWLSTKYRIARGAFGLSLVPEWEAQAEQIRADLTKTYETLYALYADLIVALPELSRIDKATEERLRREILAGELGRYPNYPEEQRRKQLLEATNQLITTQPELGVFMGLGQVAGREMYRLISSE
ncbi:MAG: hypothetical protein Fur0044_30920 [Anaerolineae bacterium]|nr:hypothetical protein [Anaerolineae bacterium]